MYLSIHFHVYNDLFLNKIEHISTCVTSYKSVEVIQLSVLISLILKALKIKTLMCLILKHDKQCVLTVV